MDLQKLFTGDIGSILTAERLEGVLRAVITVVAGLLLLRMVTAFAGKLAKKRLSAQSAMLLRKAVFYVGAALILVIALRQLGFQLTALLGAAGIAGIAIGFASQTSVSNIISGLFLVSEKPFRVGDVIKAGEHTGIVLSIDLLAVKIRTFDNQYIRIPNEKLLSSELTNVTHFAIRRMDINLSVSYCNDFHKVHSILLDVADQNPLCLRNPPPVVVYTGFGESGQEILFGVWFAKSDYVQLRNSIMPEIKRRFDAEGVEIPFPHRTLAGGLATSPLPVSVVGPRQGSAPRGIPSRRRRDHGGGSGTSSEA